MFGELYILVNITLELEAPPAPHTVFYQNLSLAQNVQRKEEASHSKWCVFTHDLSAYR